jgi:hypothetical protein
MGVLGLAPTVLADVKPIVDDGEAIVVALEKVISDIKTRNFTSVVADTQALATDVQTFATEVQAVITQIQSSNTTK